MAQQTINHGSVAGDGTGESPFSGMQKVNANFTELYAAKDAQAAALAAKAPLDNPTFTGTVSGITKAMVGLGNVDNVSDANKPVSTAQNTAIVAGDNLRLKASDMYGDFVVSGLATPVPNNTLDGVLAVGVAYVNGVRTERVATDTFTYLALRDTYVDMDSTGAIYRNAVVNGNTAPTLVAGRIRLEKVITDGSKIASVTRLANGKPATIESITSKTNLPGTNTGKTYITADTGTIYGWNEASQTYLAIGFSPITSPTKRFGGFIDGAGFPVLTPENISRVRSVSEYVGNILCDFSGSNITDFTASKMQLTTGIFAPVMPMEISPDRRFPATLRLTGSGDSLTYCNIPFTVNGSLFTITDRKATNIGMFIRGMPRADGEPFGSIRILVGQKDPVNNRINYATAYYEWRFTIPADGVERFYTLMPSASQITNGTAGVENFNYGHELGAIALRLAPNNECNKATRNPANNRAWGSTDQVFFSPLYYDAVGKKALAVIRFDDNINNGYTGTYKGVVNPKFATDYIPQLTSAAYPDANNRTFANNACGTGIAYQGRSTVKILNDSDMSWAELIKHYGFRANTYILCRHVGTPEFLTVDQLKKLRDDYGWLVGFQSYYNPVSYYQQGVKLLGPNGYNIIGTKYTSQASSVVPAVQAIETYGGFPTMRIINVGMAMAGRQGYPVIFIAGADLPATLTAGQVYWLKERYFNQPTSYDLVQNVSVHLTESDAFTGSNSIDLVTGYGGTASNIVFRYGHASSGSGASTSDYTGILLEFQKGKEWFLANGFGDGYKHWAPNQSGVDIFVEQAIEAFGEFEGVWELGTPGFYGCVPFATPTRQGQNPIMSYGRPDDPFNCRDDIMSFGNISTDGWEVKYSCSVDTATDIFTIATPPEWLRPANGETVMPIATTMPGGLAISTMYYIVQSTGTTFKLSLTKNGSPVDITSVGSGLSFNFAETAIRNQVRYLVRQGAVIQNLVHDLGQPNNIRQAIFFMDELKYWIDRGMAYCDTADVIAGIIKSERFNYNGKITL
jgi:hypothetical protein